jgi:hypothetical protein
MDAKDRPEDEVAVIDAVFQGPFTLAAPPAPVRSPDVTAPSDRPVLLSTERRIPIGPSPLRNYLRELQREYEEQEAQGKL